MSIQKREKWNPLKTSYIDSKKVNRCSFEAETLFTRLIAASDDNSNFDGAPSLLACKLYAEKMKHGTITFEQVEKMKGELIKNELIVEYEIDGEKYIHIPNNKKFIRGDIKPDIRFPSLSQDVENKEDNESGTNPARIRNENVAPTTPTTTDSTTDSTTQKNQIQDTENRTPVEENSPKNSLVLGLKFWELLEKKFRPMSDREQTTFKRVAQHLALSKVEYDRVVNALNRAMTGQSPKGLFVQICKKEFGYKPSGKVL